MLMPTQNAYIRKEESCPTVMASLAINRPPLYNTLRMMIFPLSPVCERNENLRAEVEGYCTRQMILNWLTDYDEHNL